MIYTRVKDNGVVEVKLTPPDGDTRIALAPGDDITGLPEEVKALCLTTWTPDVVAAFTAIQCPPLTVEESITKCRDAITDFANAKYAAGLVYGGFTYQIDATSRTEIGLRAVYATNSTIDPVNFPWTDSYDRGWRDKANVYHPMTASEFMAFGKAVSYYCSCIKCCCDDHKDAITADNCTAYDYSTGWPV